MTLRLHKASLVLVAAALLLCGCRKDQPVLGISVALDAPTKSSPEGSLADRCRLQIYNGGTLCYDRTVEVVDGRAKFNDVILERDRRYDYLFWADNAQGDFYNTDDLHAVALKGAFGICDDRRDAFCGAALDQEVEAMCDTTLILRRPFAQLNAVTCDIPDICAQLSEGCTLSSVLPDSVHLRICDVPASFNVASGEAEGSSTVDASAAVYQLLPEGISTLAMGYLFAGDGDDGRLTRVDFRCTNSSAGFVPVEFSWENVPVRRNWRSNVIGDLLTNGTEVKVTVTKDWIENN